MAQTHTEVTLVPSNLSKIEWLSHRMRRRHWHRWCLMSRVSLARLWGPVFDPAPLCMLLWGYFLGVISISIRRLWAKRTALHTVKALILILKLKALRQRYCGPLKKKFRHQTLPLDLTLGLEVAESAPLWVSCLLACPLCPSVCLSLSLHAHSTVCFFQES